MKTVVINTGLACCALGVLGVLPTSIYAASFDCQQAKLPAEKAICQYRNLNDQDVKMVTTFNILTQLLPMGGRDALKDEQRVWLQQRNACASKVSCIATQYQQRQTQLDELLATRVYQQGPF
jgi:uncharacterized protein